MGRSWSLGTYLGIPVKVHWSFGFIFILIGYFGTSEGLSVAEVLWLVALVLCVFFCIVLHEYGHALMARTYKVVTRDIIIFPIGGVARLEHIPQIPKQELRIAIAGPLVNVAIALVLSLVFILIYGWELNFAWQSFRSGEGLNGSIAFLIGTNCLLFLFNLIPAFPMDGGRILRAILTYKMGIARATNVATIIARIMAGIIIIVGVWLFQPTWIAIGIFVVVMSSAENKQIQFSEKMKNIELAQLYTEPVIKLMDSDQMSKLFEIYHAGKVKNFLVFGYDDQLVGTMPEIFIRKHLQNEARISVDPIARWMSKNFLTLPTNTNMHSAVEAMNNKGVVVVAVSDISGEIKFALDRGQIGDYVNK